MTGVLESKVLALGWVIVLYRFRVEWVRVNKMMNRNLKSIVLYSVCIDEVGVQIRRKRSSSVRWFVVVVADLLRRLEDPWSSSSSTCLVVFAVEPHCRFAVKLSRSLRRKSTPPTQVIGLSPKKLSPPTSLNFNVIFRQFSIYSLSIL